MPTAINIVLCACVAVGSWTVLGYAIARRLVHRSLALPLAPAFGWAVHSACALPVLMLVGFSAAAVAIVFVAVLVASVATLFIPLERHDYAAGAEVPGFVFFGVALLALCVAVAIVPKFDAAGVGFATPIFDHSKIAMIDEMVRSGVPPANPFFEERGDASRLSYYYLWHFGAAELAVLTGATGWEADIALTWFTALASVLLMAGLANWYAERASAAVWVVLLSFALSLRYVLASLFDPERIIDWIFPGTGFGGWLFQAAWAPQHIAAASALVLAIFFLTRLAHGPVTLNIFCIALLAAAGFESSAWLGGIVFPVAAAIVGLMLTVQLEPRQRMHFIARCAVAAVLAIAVASPLLYDQFVAATRRGDGSPIVWDPFEVLGLAFPPELRRVLDLPAYWLVLLPVEFPAVFVSGVAAWICLRSREWPVEKRRTLAGLLVLALTSLVGSWLFRSTIGDNNDFGWRAVLPGAMILTILAAVGLSRWIARRSVAAVSAAIGLWLLGLPEGIAAIHQYAVGHVDPDGAVFSDTPALWAAVRRHAAANERIANNPAFLQDVTPWPVNLSWALLSNRRSCFAGRELTLAATALPRGRREEISAQFLRVFAGDASAADIEGMAGGYNCIVVVVTPQDGAWRKDPFAASPLYRLVESNDHWRIYRIIDVGR